MSLARAATVPTTRVAVTVTFLRQDTPPLLPPAPLPQGATIAAVTSPSVPFYRYLYDTVGAPWVWWLRRTISDQELAAILSAPGHSLHVLYAGGEPAGFYELDGRPSGAVNLAYFGLMPHAIGRGLGWALLRAAIEEAWRRPAAFLTVNTCTADHPRALPNYKRAGFVPVREIREVWDVPGDLGLVIPASLRV